MIKRENVAIFDDRGIPSIMVKFTKESNKSLFGGSDKAHAMFTVGGKTYDEIYISKYINTFINSRPYSLPFTQSASDITNDEAARLCFDKGAGWHLLTAPEWGYLALDSLRNGTLPHGNTEQGCYPADKNEKGWPYNGGKTRTGSGPATWSHDHTPFGVYDLCGNMWEMVRGLRLVDGVLQTAENNDAAQNIGLDENSPLWVPVKDGDHSIKISAGSTIRFTTTDIDKGWTGTRWENVKFECAITEQLKELALFAGEPNAYFYANTEGERFPLRGGCWLDGAKAGVFYSNLSHPRSYSFHRVGFRSAYYGQLQMGY